MNDVYIPIEFIIIVASIKERKKTVTGKEVMNYKNKCPYPIEFNSDETLHLCNYDEDNDIYTIKDNIQVPSYILQLLTSF